MTHVTLKRICVKDFFDPRWASRHGGETIHGTEERHLQWLTQSRACLRRLGNPDYTSKLWMLLGAIKLPLSRSSLPPGRDPFLLFTIEFIWAVIKQESFNWAACSLQVKKRNLPFLTCLARCIPQESENSLGNSLCWATFKLMSKRHMPLFCSSLRFGSALLVPTWDGNLPGLLLSQESQLPCVLTWFMHTGTVRSGN